MQMQKQGMKFKLIIEELEHLSEHGYINIQDSDKKRLIFKNREEVFKLFGGEKKEVLTPFNDYTYVWLHSFLRDLTDYLSQGLKENSTDMEEAFNKFYDIMSEYIDSEVDVYTSDLTEWLNDRNSNIYYLDEAHKEFRDSDNILGIAQYKAIEEIYFNAYELLKEHLNNKFNLEF